MIGQNLFKVDYRDADNVRTAYVVVPSWEDLVDYIHACKSTLVRAECLNVDHQKITPVLIAPPSFRGPAVAVGVKP